MSEWKGPWWCKECGVKDDYCSCETTDAWIPYDRRAPDPEKAELVDVLDSIVEHVECGLCRRKAQALLRRIEGGEEDRGCHHGPDCDGRGLDCGPRQEKQS